MVRSRFRTQIRVGWMAAAITAVMAVVIAVPVSWVVMLLIGAAHSADPAVPPLGWLATLYLTLALWMASWVVKTDVQMRDATDRGR